MKIVLFDSQTLIFVIKYGIRNRALTDFLGESRTSYKCDPTSYLYDPLGLTVSARFAQNVQCTLIVNCRHGVLTSSEESVDILDASDPRIVAVRHYGLKTVLKSKKKNQQEHFVESTAEY